MTLPVRICWFIFTAYLTEGGWGRGRGCIYFWQSAPDFSSHKHAPTTQSALCGPSCQFMLEFGSWGINSGSVFISSLSPSGQAVRRGGGGGGGWDSKNEDPIQTRRPQIAALPSLASQPPQAHRSPGLLHRILSKCRRKSECQGATNGAFEGDWEGLLFVSGRWRGGGVALMEMCRETKSPKNHQVWDHWWWLHTQHI